MGRMELDAWDKQNGRSLGLGWKQSGSQAFRNEFHACCVLSRCSSRSWI